MPERVIYYIECPVSTIIIELFEMKGPNKTREKKG